MISVLILTFIIYMYPDLQNQWGKDELVNKLKPLANHGQGIKLDLLPQIVHPYKCQKCNLDVEKAF